MKQPLPRFACRRFTSGYLNGEVTLSSSRCGNPQQDPRGRSWPPCTYATCSLLTRMLPAPCLLCHSFAPPIRYAFELLTNALWKRDYDLFGIDEHSESFLVGEFQVLVTSMVYSGSLRCAHAIHQCLEEEREKIMTIPRKEKKRKARREEKAEKAAVLDMVFRRCTGRETDDFGRLKAKIRKPPLSLSLSCGNSRRSETLQLCFAPSPMVLAAEEFFHEEEVEHPMR
ncbi:hypothetical protein ZIOFF_019576 [Zingiber officinale]|uniref:Uncharacterized protein n=1 Tax=Zingiber officinale TaxID=94328 RepID=A0A8J5LJC5_ZINOF|nr:hypothetical protein ZIOFF_019576 [Zingiber officinale]